MLYLAEVVDKPDRPPRRNIHAYAATLGLGYGVDGRLRYMMGIETDERTVNIEEQCFYHE
jgi:hypothetical protein